MAHIFEIKSADAELRIKGKTYKFIDPTFSMKAMVHAKWLEIDLKKDQLSDAEWSKEIHKINCEQIKSYLPEMTDEVLASMGHEEFGLLLKALGQAAEIQLGAQLEVTEKK